MIGKFESRLFYLPMDVPAGIKWLTCSGRAVFASAVVPMVIRLFIVLGVGVRKGEGKGKGE